MVDNIETDPMDVNVNFSRAELLDILRFLGVNAFLGVDVTTVAEMPDDKREFMYQLARNTLAARKIMMKDDAGEWKMDPFILTALSICAAPYRSVIMTHQQPSRPASNYFFHTSAANDITVLHQTNGSEIHKFYVSRGERPISSTLNKVLQIESVPSQDGPSIRLSQSLMTQARDKALEQGAAEAGAILKANEIPPETAVPFAQTLANPTAFSTIAQIVHGDEDEGETLKEGGFTVLHGADMVWLARPQAGASAQTDGVIVLSIGGRDILRIITDLVDES
jgi:hypothetical protein